MQKALDMFRLISRIIQSFIFDAVKLFFLKKFFSKKKGSQFLNEIDSKKFLNSRNKGLLIDGKNSRLSLKESYQNLCLSARVGTGKTTKYIIPNVLDKANELCSMAIHDPKGEVHALTSGYLKSKGFNIIKYDVEDIQSSHFFNPCQEAQNEVEIEQVAETIIWCGNPSEKDPYWNNGATRILSVLLKCLSFGEKKYNNLANLTHLLNNFGKMGEGLDNWISKNCWNSQYPNDDYVLQQWKGALTGNEEAIQSFVGICLTSLKALTNRDLRLFFSQNDFNLSRFRTEKTAIFFVTPPDKQKYYSFVTSLFFSALFRELMRNKYLTQDCLSAYILYDEFGNSYISDFVSIANTIRGYKVSLSLILQSITQLGYRYGKVSGEAIQGAINTNICLSGADPVTCDYFSSLIGRVRETQARQFGNTTEYREYNLLNPDEVRQLEDNELIIISRNRNPYKLKVKAFYQNRTFNRQSKINPYRLKRKKMPELKLVELD